MYHKEQLFEKALPYFSGNVLATNVWIDKYALRLKTNPNYFVELSPDETITRIAKEFYRIEKWYDNPLSYEEIYEVLDKFKFIVPGGSSIYGIGNDDSLSSLANCFVVGNEVDSYGSICMTDQEQTQLMKRRGGVGHDLSHLRPEGALVNGSARTSTGAISFAPRYSNSTREVALLGRRGALMLSFDVKHPDADKFIKLKSDRTTCTGANISLKVDDEFMKAVKYNKDIYIQQFPINSQNPQIIKSTNPANLWKDFVETSHAFAEPGLLFWDAIKRESIPSCYGPEWEEKSCNPCFPETVNLLTPQGLKLLKDIEIGDVIWSASGWTKVVNKVYSGEKEVFRYNTSFGNIDCTSNHKIISSKGKIEIEKAEDIRILSDVAIEKESKYATIVSKEFLGIKDVYDITVSNDTHTFWCEGFDVCNCGEIPLCPYDSCRLLAINLYSYVINPFVEGDASFDFELFAKHIRIAQRLMDDVVELEKEKILGILKHIERSYEDKEISRIEINLWNKVLDKLERGRRTGLGIMGGSDMIAALNLQYGTKKATDFIVDVMKFMAIETYKTSIDLAVERGSFPMWNVDKEKDNPFLKRILNNLPNDYLKKYNESGRRNIACLTVAPTGTISIEAQVNGGFEPVFAINYKRRKKVNPNDVNVNITFIDESGDSWEEYIVFHKPFVDWFNINYKNLVKEFPHLNSKLEKNEEILDELISKSPYYKCSANEIDVYEKIRMQGHIQKWIDHSISITHNLPEDISIEEISQIFLTAWEVGCKGCTIYREGSRSGVLVKDTASEINFRYIDAIKRPQSLECDVHCIKALKQQWIVLIGKVDNKPFEIFNFPKKNISEKEFELLFDFIEHEESCWKSSTLKQKEGRTFIIEKYGKRQYSLKSWDGHEIICIIEDIVERMENDDDKSDTKRISMELRHGIHPKFIAQIIEKQYTNMTAFDNAASRILKNYIGDGEFCGKICDICKGKMIYQGGCEICQQCGNSKCS